MLPSFADDTVDRIRAPQLTVGGNLTAHRDWANATDTTVTGCQLQPEQSERERDTDRFIGPVRWRVFAPDGTDLVDSDRVRYRGEVYEIAGDIDTWTSATGVLDHLTAVLRERPRMTARCTITRGQHPAVVTVATEVPCAPRPGLATREADSGADEVALHTHRVWVAWDTDVRRDDVLTITAADDPAYLGRYLTVLEVGPDEGDDERYVICRETVT